MLKVPKAVVSVNWLREHLDNETVFILDATLPKVGVSLQEKEFIKKVIPKAIFFDIKGEFSQSDANFPNTMIDALSFQEKVRDLGICSDSCVILYDDHGVYSSPRAYWMFRSMGFSNVAVLDGGLPSWKQANYHVVSQHKSPTKKGNFIAKKQTQFFVDYNFVQTQLQSKNCQILDARSEGRFYGKEPEPRKGVRSGHIPLSKSLPYSDLLHNGHLKSKEELHTLFKPVAHKNTHVIASCGTGITACVIALAAHQIGYDHISVYDGSWTEWGSLLDLPIEL